MEVKRNVQQVFVFLDSYYTILVFDVDCVYICYRSFRGFTLFRLLEFRLNPGTLDPNLQKEGPINTLRNHVTKIKCQGRDRKPALDVCLESLCGDILLGLCHAVDPVVGRCKLLVVSHHCTRLLEI